MPLSKLEKKFETKGKLVIQNENIKMILIFIILTFCIQYIIIITMTFIYFITKIEPFEIHYLVYF